MPPKPQNLLLDMLNLQSLLLLLLQLLLCYCGFAHA
jgi:hypothetical protein